jgi:NADH-quinone oxidoreductase subunit J
MTVFGILLAAVIVACALGVVFARSPITAAVSLLVGFLGLAILYLVLHAEFVAAVQVLVYAGGIMVLYLFGIMLVDNQVLRLTRQVHFQAWPAFVLVLALFLWMGHRLYHSEYAALPGGRPAATATAHAGAPGESAPAADNTRRIAKVLYGEFLYPFEAASILLLVAVVGGVFLAKKEV